MGNANPFLGANCVDEIVSDAELVQAFAHTSYGTGSRAELRLAVLKCASGWYQCHTTKTIGQKLGLITDEYHLTSKGRVYLWHSNQGDCDI
ncbi:MULTISPECIES: hypothetical protein [Pseudomonas]|uniref:hypothetical protein n=1 Tax=Pseudomonas TaxID=286 RepID=UPI00387B6B8C